jgi:UDP-glucose 4-epimerase
VSAAPSLHLETPPELAGQRVLITGGAGFIGSTLAGLLLDRNDVVVLDNLSRNALQYKPYANHPRLTLVEGSVLDASTVKEAMTGVDYVVHCAGIAGIDTVIQRPVETMRVNMIGSANVLESAVGQPRIKRVVCFSTSEVFGQLAFRSRETAPAVLGAVGEGRWTYAVSKLAEEHLAYAYFKQEGLATVTVRPFNVYGPGQVGEGAVRDFVRQALAGEDLVIYGDGTQIRAWCYIDDMIRGLLLAMVTPAAVGESFNIGNHRAVITVYGLASTVIRVLDVSSKIRFEPRASPDIELRIPRVEKARELLGFEAQVDLEEGIRRTAKYFAVGSRAEGGTTPPDLISGRAR